MIIVQRRIPPFAAALIVLTLVTSIAAAIDARAGGDLYARLALLPEAVWRGQLWRLATWTLVEGGPLALIFGCVTLYWFGGDLHGAWGGRRFARFVIAIVLIAGVGTSLLARVVPDAWLFPHLGGWALGDALVIAWALEFPARRIRVYMVLVVGGPLLAYGTFAVTVLFAIFYGAAWVLPELCAGGAALLHMTGALRRWRLKLERWRVERKLRVVRGGREEHGPYWN